jgi:hypothetical protein
MYALNSHPQHISIHKLSQKHIEDSDIDEQSTSIQLEQEIPSKDKSHNKKASIKKHNQNHNSCNTNHKSDTRNSQAIFSTHQNRNIDSQKNSFNIQMSLKMDNTQKPNSLQHICIPQYLYHVPHIEQHAIKTTYSNACSSLSPIGSPLVNHHYMYPSLMSGYPLYMPVSTFQYNNICKIQSPVNCPNRFLSTQRSSPQLITKKDLLSDEIDIDTFIKESKVFMKSSDISNSVSYSSAAKQRSFERVLKCTNSNDACPSKKRAVALNSFNIDKGAFKGKIIKSISILDGDTLQMKPSQSKRGSTNPPKNLSPLETKQDDAKNDYKYTENSRESMVSFSAFKEATKLCKTEYLKKKNCTLKEAQHTYINTEAIYEKSNKPPVPPHIKKNSKICEGASSDSKLKGKGISLNNKSDNLKDEMKSPSSELKPILLSFNMSNNSSQIIPPKISQSKNTPKKDTKKEKTKEELAEYRKKIMKRPHSHKSEIISSSCQKPKGSSAGLERLAQGKKPAISYQEMLRHTHKKYMQLPEIQEKLKKKEDEETKKQDLKCRKQAVQELEKVLILIRKGKGFF